MDVTFINPFLEAAVNVLQTMAFTETQVGKPCLKSKTPLSPSDVTGIRGSHGEQAWLASREFFRSCDFACGVEYVR
jgi:chemotaxis protein CheX